MFIRDVISSALGARSLRVTQIKTANRIKRNRSFKYRLGSFISVISTALVFLAVLSGGPLMDDVYKLEQYHCHWGCSDSRGSEHTVDGQAFAGEVKIAYSDTISFRHAASDAVRGAVRGSRS